MSAMKLSGKEYPASESAVAFLNGYLDRVRRYVETNRLGNEYVQDLENRIAEKLSLLSREATEGDAVKIVNELGEPEYIFADVSKNRSAPSGDSPSGWHKAPFYRDSANGVIFGVCAGLGERFGIDPFYVRVLFIAFFFLFGSSVLVYLLLALIMKDKSGSALSQETVRSKIQEGAERTTEAVSSIPRSTVNAARNAVSTLGRIVGFVFFSLLAVFLISVSFGFFAVFGLALSGIVIDNQSIFGYVHPVTAYAFGAAGAALFLLGWGAGAKALTGKSFSGWNMAVPGLLFVAALAGGSYGSLQTATKFLHREAVETQSEIAIASGTLSVRFENGSNPAIGRGWGDEFGNPSLSTQILFVRSEDGKASVRSLTEVSAPSAEEAGALVSLAKPLTVSGSGNALTLGNTEVSFTQKVPYAFPMRTIVFSVPDSVSVRLSNLPRGMRVRELDTGLGQFGSYVGGRGCQGGAVRYFESAGAFACDPASYGENEIRQAKTRFLEETGYERAPKAPLPEGMEDAIPYSYDDSIRAEYSTGGLYTVTYGLGYPHPRNVPDTVTKTYRVDVSPEGTMTATEL